MRVGGKAGQIYLFFGKKNWSGNTLMSNANASFLGKQANDRAGRTIAGAGDLNGDGYDDVLVAAGSNNGAGQVYLIFGKSSNWSIDTKLSNINSSFIGEKSGDVFGRELSGGGDVNNDGFDDILIGSPWNSDNGQYSGKVYLVLGRSDGWTNNTDISNLIDSSSFIGESAGDFASSVAIAGDVNGDGSDDILIGASGNDDSATNAGKVYVIFPEFDMGPEVVHSVKAYSDVGCNNPITRTEIGKPIYIELRGQDTNASKINYAAVNITNCMNISCKIRLYLTETGVNSDEFRGMFKISNRTSAGKALINANIGDNITISSVTDPTKNVTLPVTIPIQIRPFEDKTSATEDEVYFAHYWNFGYNSVSDWTIQSDAQWLYWDSTNQNFYGIPNNGDVGTFWVQVNITDGLGNYDEHYFSILVNNTPPNITTENVVFATEDQKYSVDYDCSDDGQGTITWHLNTNASWLSLGEFSGVLSGTPSNDDRGKYWVNISVDDGNSGWDYSDFEITVLDTNDPPIIISKNITNAIEDEFYSLDFNATDIDGTSSFEWYLDTDASWLSLEKDYGIISGTPENEDVGISYVNVTVSDSREGEDSYNFTLEVLNTNDPPGWTVVPDDITLNEGDLYVFDVNATDEDIGDDLTYSISSIPLTNITIDPDSGVITWSAWSDDLDGSEFINVIVTASDGEEYIFSYFDIGLIPNSPPTTNQQPF
jgi:hypothetical protein